jgi:hypothetical protein
MSRRKMFITTVFSSAAVRNAYCCVSHLDGTLPNEGHLSRVSGSDWFTFCRNI